MAQFSVQDKKQSWETWIKQVIIEITISSIVMGLKNSYL